MGLSTDSNVLIKDLNLSLSEDEIACIKKILVFFDDARNLQLDDSLGCYDPNNPTIKVIRELQKSLIHCSSYTHNLRKFNNLPVEFLHQLVFAALNNKNIDFNVECMKILFSLTARIANKLSNFDENVDISRE